MKTKLIKRERNIFLVSFAMFLLTGSVYAAIPQPGAGQSHRQRFDPPPTASANIDLSSPEKTLATFADALAHNDFDSAVRCVAGAVTSEFTRQLTQGPKPSFVALRLDHLKIMTSNEDTVVATFTAVPVLPGGADGAKGDSETLTLRRNDMGWQIVPVEPARLRPNPKAYLYAFSFILLHQEVGIRARERALEAQKHQVVEKDVISQMPGLAVGKIARLYQDERRTPVFVAMGPLQLEKYATYTSLRELRRERPSPIQKTQEGFSDSELNDALKSAKSEAEQLIASGDVLFLPHGTHIKFRSVSRLNRWEKFYLRD